MDQLISLEPKLLTIIISEIIAFMYIFNYLIKAGYNERIFSGRTSLRKKTTKVEFMYKVVRASRLGFLGVSTGSMLV